MTPYAQMLMTYLPAECQATYAYEYQRYGKDPTLAFVLQMFGWALRRSSYYLGNFARGILMALGTAHRHRDVITVPVWIVRCCTIGSKPNATTTDRLRLAYRYLPLRSRPGTARAADPHPPQHRRRPNGARTVAPVVVLREARRDRQGGLPDAAESASLRGPRRRATGS